MTKKELSKRDENLDTFKTLLKIAVDDNLSLVQKIDAGWQKIKFFYGDKTIAKKIVCLFYPNRYLNVFKTEDMQYFCKRLQIDYETSSFDKYGQSYDKLTIGQKYELLTNLLLEFKSKNDLAKKWSNIRYGYFLYEELKEVRDVVPRASSQTRLKRNVSPLGNYGLLFEPTSHEEILYMFSVMHRELGFPYIVKIQTGYPDVIAMDQNRKNVRIELEVLASQFDHDPKDCDLIICWKNDVDPKPDGWKEIIALKDLV